MSIWPIEVKRGHVALLRFVWTTMMPQHYEWFSVEDAKTTWAKFRADPADPSLKHLKRAVNELYLLHIQCN